MKLAPWRGANTLICDVFGLPVLVLAPDGMLTDAHGTAACEHPVELHRPLDALARCVARWIEWTGVEPGEFRARDIHPAIRAQVSDLVPFFVETER